MKKFMKFFVGLASIGATVAGAYYVVKKFLLKDAKEDFDDDFDDDFDEDFDDDIFNDSDEDGEKDVVPVKMEESGADESADDASGESEETEPAE